MHLAKAREFINRYPEITKDFKGCTAEQLSALEHKLGHTLPVAYKEFLTWMGHKGGNLFRGSDVFYPHLIGSIWQKQVDRGLYSELPSLLEGAVELLNEHSFDGKKLLKDSIVIMNHQGSMVHFIKTTEGDNPPVYMFRESGNYLTDGPQIYCSSFGDFLLNSFQRQISALKKLGDLE